MWSRLQAMFRGHPVSIQGTGALPEGQARCIALGDPLAGGTEVILARVDGVLRAVDRRCPHEGGRILDGELVEGRYVICPLHNYKFDPASGKAIGVACANARTYKVRERGGDAELWAS